METCRSGLTYLLAKEAGLNRPRGFKSHRLRKKETRKGFLRRRARHLRVVRVGFERRSIEFSVENSASRWPDQKSSTEDF